jgi:hypothetical protein
MFCCDPCVIEDKEITGVCSFCESDINQDGQCVEDICSYSPLQCDQCGWQPCDLSC